MRVSVVWDHIGAVEAEHDYISHTSLVVHFIISVTVKIIFQSIIFLSCKVQSPVSRRTGNVREVDQDESGFERLNSISSNKVSTRHESECRTVSSDVPVDDDDDDDDDDTFHESTAISCPFSVIVKQSWPLYYVT